jgi:hypothetical protein
MRYSCDSARMAAAVFFGLAPGTAVQLILRALPVVHVQWQTSSLMALMSVQVCASSTTSVDCVHSTKLMYTSDAGPIEVYLCLYYYVSE